MKQLKRGILVAFEGIDGSGKSTIARVISEHFKALQLPVLCTKEPGATSLGLQLRTIVQEKKVPLCAQAEYLLFAADRAQHFTEMVLPALAHNMLVISDRLADSSLAYQGFGRGLDKELITRVNLWTMQGKEPDMVVYLRVSPAVAAERILKRNQALTAFEKEKTAFINRVFHGFETLFSARSNVIIIDGEQPLQTVISNTMQELEQWINTQQLMHQ